MAAPLELFPRARVNPEEFAQEQAEHFTGRRLRIGRSGIVHEVAWRPWLGELILPGPACHQGWSGFAASGDLLATDDPATCRKCAHRATQLPLLEPAAQAALFELEH